jgi:hypothetical protein
MDRYDKSRIIALARRYPRRVRRSTTTLAFFDPRRESLFAALADATSRLAKRLHLLTAVNHVQNDYRDQQQQKQRLIPGNIIANSFGKNTRSYHVKYSFDIDFVKTITTFLKLSVAIHAKPKSSSNLRLRLSLAATGFEPVT